MGVVCYPNVQFTVYCCGNGAKSVFPLHRFVAGLITPVVSMFDDTCVWTVIVCVVSGGIVMGVLVWTLYNFRFLGFSSVAIEYVR